MNFHGIVELPEDIMSPEEQVGPVEGWLQSWLKHNEELLVV